MGQRLHRLVCPRREGFEVEDGALDVGASQCFGAASRLTSPRGESAGAPRRVLQTRRGRGKRQIATTPVSLPDAPCLTILPLLRPLRNPLVRLGSGHGPSAALGSSTSRTHAADAASRFGKPRANSASRAAPSGAGRHAVSGPCLRRSERFSRVQRGSSFSEDCSPRPSSSSTSAADSASPSCKLSFDMQACTNSSPVPTPPCAVGDGP